MLENDKNEIYNQHLFFFFFQVSAEVLKKRAERFGLVAGSASEQVIVQFVIF